MTKKKTAVQVHDEVIALLRFGTLGMQADQSELDAVITMLSALDGQSRRTSGARVVVSQTKPAPNARLEAPTADLDVWLVPGEGRMTPGRAPSPGAGRASRGAHAAPRTCTR